MARADRQQVVLDILQDLHSLDGLKKLFWEELNYERENKPLSLRQWPDSVRQALAETPILFASGGEENSFHIIYCRLNSPELKRGLERPIVDQFLREHPYALFVFSNKNQSAWHFLNVKFDEQVERRRLFRRITVRPGAGLRTATERIQLLDLAEIKPELFGITPLAIQQRCDVAFDVEAVTKDFFREIANWYFWAVRHVRFPKDAPKEDDGHDHISVIRLITRLIFCWFVKEKGLIPDTLFDERKLTQILTGFEPTKTTENESVFYRAILQNLFFATLNTEMDKRDWTKEEQNFMAHSLYRYREYFSEPKSALDLFKEIPFLNGGLFECLDKDLGENAKPRYIRIDGFSRREDSQPIVPDFLFFGGEREVDLSADYGDKKFRRVPVRGLIHIFNRYHFTIEENTPIEQEVALDPELSGKVFENLLAAYNPETGATARKQTGSFYTPREIVNYMVDEALIACLKTKLEDALPSAKDGEARLRHLFAYNDEPHQFTAPEVDALIAAIDGLKSLDPAVGSGAFPMGILHKLVFILGKLDLRNEKWKERQIARVRDTLAIAEMIEDSTARERAVRELEQQITSINEAFEHNELDYGRKLYLIENCIYGVDIQPIAVQIAKMRFFISLIVDQKIDDTQPNRGVRPLPNLETKFVAANSLIGVNRPGQQLLPNPNIDAKEADLRRVRERHFLARTPKQKAKCRDDDARLRAEIAELLKGDGWDTTTARNLASWNPYDQNTTADFFDAEWMFGITDGFDISIGNPPYNAELSDLERAFYKAHYASVSSGRQDTAAIFVELATRVCGARGLVSYILPYRLFSRKRNHGKFQTWLLTNYALTEVLYLGSDVGFTANDEFMVVKVDCAQNKSTMVRVAWKPELARGRDAITFRVIKQSAFLDYGEINLNLLRYDQGLLRKISVGTLELETVCKVRDGIVPHIRDRLVSDRKRDNRYVRFAGIAGHYTLQRYFFTCDELWLCYDINEAKKYISDPVELRKVQLREKEIFLSRKIITSQNSATLKGTIDEDKTFVSNSIHSSYLRDEFQNRVALEYVLALINSKLLNFFHDSLRVKATDLHPQILVGNLKKLPIKLTEEALQQKIVKLVSKIITTKKSNPDANTTTLEDEIDQQVYALYGLTPEEIKIVEAVSK